MVVVEMEEEVEVVKKCFLRVDGVTDHVSVCRGIEFRFSLPVDCASFVTQRKLRALRSGSNRGRDALCVAGTLGA
jgi:hypothetical protein